MIAPSRRGFITGLVSFIAAPAIVRAGSLMPIKAVRSFSVEEIINLALQRIGEQMDPPYGVSPMMGALHEFRVIESINGVLRARYIPLADILV